LHGRTPYGVGVAARQAAGGPIGPPRGVRGVPGGPAVMPGLPGRRGVQDEPPYVGVALVVGRRGRPGLEPAAVRGPHGAVPRALLIRPCLWGGPNQSLQQTPAALAVPAR